MADVISAFLDAMTAAGVVPVEPIADRLGPDRIYFRCESDSKGRKTGWAKLYLDGRPAGSFGSYKLGIAHKWRFSDTEGLSPQERRAMAQECREAAAKRQAEQQERWATAAEICRLDWQNAQAANPAHPYLVSKGIPGEAVRQHGNRLLIPMFDAAGELWNLQRIAPDGFKLYTKEARTKGLFMMIGEPGDRLVIAEGYGTGAVIRRATGLAVAVAFTWTNLETVARIVRDQHPDADIIIAADDDAHLVDHPTIQRNIGLEAARAAAEAVGGRLAVPPRKQK